MKKLIKELPLSNFISKYFWKIRNNSYRSISRRFWTERYKQEEGTSGPGSYGRLAEFKVETINGIIKEYGIKSVIDFGCGDGNQIRKLDVSDYLGVDVSEDAVERCKRTFTDDMSKHFLVADQFKGQTSDMAISLDVIFHLVEDETYEQYMRNLFGAGERFVLIYSSDFDQICINPFARPTHVRHRRFSRWVAHNASNFQMIKKITNPYKLTAGTTPQTHSLSDFYLFALK